MYKLKTLSALVLAAAVWSSTQVPMALAAKPGNIEFSSETTIWLEGDSTLHPFKLVAKKYAINATVTSLDLKDVAADVLLDLDVSIPTKSLKSGESALDDNTYKALEATKYPIIRFALDKARVKVGKDDVDVVATGRLVIHGVEKTTEIRAKGHVEDNKFKLTGKKELLMTDFGVKPPVLMFGAIKVDDRVTIKYDLVGEVQP